MKGRRLIVAAATGAIVVVPAGTGLAVARNANGWRAAGELARQQTPATRLLPRPDPMPPMMVRSEADYLRHMVPHHEEAVRAARQLARSNRPELRRFAAEIVATQNREIKQMKAWLSRWYPGQPQRAPYSPMMRNLSSLRGDALDRAFLEDMIPHHRHAVMMSQHLLMHRLARHAEIVPFAERIRDTQRREIAQMQRWLTQWFHVRGGDGMPGHHEGMGPRHRGHDSGMGPGHSGMGGGGGNGMRGGWEMRPPAYRSR